MFFDSKKVMEEAEKCGQRSRIEYDRVIQEKYDGDEDRYYKEEVCPRLIESTKQCIAAFNMITAAHYLSMGPSEIDECLRKYLPASSERLKVLDDNIKCRKQKDFVYPGGYAAFVDDAQNGCFGEVPQRRWKGVSLDEKTW